MADDFDKTDVFDDDPVVDELCDFQISACAGV